MMETIIPPHVGMRLRTMREKKYKKKKKEKTKREGALLVSFTTLVLQSSAMFSYGESPMLSLSYTSGNFSL